MDVSGFMVDSATVAAVSGVTGTKGDPSYAATTTVMGRYQAGRDRSASDIAHEAVFYSLTEIAVDSRFWPPGESAADATKARRAVKTYKTHDKRGGYTLYKTLLGR